jgi:hypothetical protein
MLIKPFIRGKTAFTDFCDGLQFLQVLAKNDREFDWACHYVFEPLKQLDNVPELAGIGSRRKGRFVPSYELFKRISRETSDIGAGKAAAQPIPLARVESLLYRMVRVPNDYVDACRVIHSQRLPLRNAWTMLHPEVSCQSFGDMLLHRLRQFDGLTPSEKTTLDLRARYSFDNREHFLNALQEKQIPGSEGLLPVYLRVAGLEAEDKVGFYPVNLRWYGRLPKDLCAFLQDYRRK